MLLVPARDLRIRPADVWRKLKKHGDLVITNNGKPAALMLAVTSETFEQTSDLLRRARAMRALEAIHRHAVASGASRLSDPVIAREIKAARASRAARSPRR